MKLLNLVLVFVYLSSLCLGLPREHRQENSLELPFLDINSFFSDKESIVMILPSHETNGDKQKQIHEYAKKVFRFIEESSILIDEEALKKDLSQNSVIVYGTPEGNRWLSKFFSEIPVKLERDRITLQKKAFSGNDLRFISLCLGLTDNRYI
jgi:DNA polymerase III delta subunit